MTSTLASRIGIVVGAIACPSFADAGSSHLQFLNVHGHEFSVIGNPGNAAYVYHPSPNPNVPPINIGRVDYTYAITTTEVTGSQWFRFVQAYAPFVNTGFVMNDAFTSNSAFFTGFNGQGVPQFQYIESAANTGGAMGWRFAARYVNWLHNGMPDVTQATAADFEQGAYDTSTFGAIPKTAIRISPGAPRARASGSPRGTSGPRPFITTPTATARARRATGNTPTGATIRSSRAIPIREARPTPGSTAPAALARRACTPMCARRGGCGTRRAAKPNGSRITTTI